MGQSVAVMRKSARDVFLDGQAWADQVPQCRAMIDEIEHAFGNADAGSETMRPRLPLLAQAVRAWLGDKTMSVLTRKRVAIKVGRAYDWCGLFEDKEIEAGRSRHSAVSRWLNEGARWPFSGGTARRWAWCAVQNQYWLPGMGKRRPLLKHEYYHQLLEQLDSNATTRGNLAAEAPGIYQCFRPSIIYPGRYVFGLFAVALVPDSPRHPADPPSSGDGRNNYAPVLRTIELHRLTPGSSATEESTIPPEMAKAPSVEEFYRGYLVKKSRQVLVHAFDSITSAFRFTVITNFVLSETIDAAGHSPRLPRREAAKMQIMSGIAVGLVGQVGFYSVPEVWVRVAEINPAACESDEQIIGQMRQAPGHDGVGILPMEQIPDFVRRQFQVIERQVVLTAGVP